jgi:hypothetical protein
MVECVWTPIEGYMAQVPSSVLKSAASEVVQAEEVIPSRSEVGLSALLETVLLPPEIGKVASFNRPTWG